MEALRVVIDGSVIKMLLNQMLEERGHHSTLQKIHGSNEDHPRMRFTRSDTLNRASLK